MTSAKAWVAAIYASIGSALSGLAVVLIGDMTLSELTQGQWLAIGIAAFTNFGAAFGLTWATSNKAAPAPIGYKVTQFDADGRLIG